MGARKRERCVRGRRLLKETLHGQTAQAAWPRSFGGYGIEIYRKAAGIVKQ